MECRDQEKLVGRKIVMAIAGILLVIFVIGHLVGNCSIYGGPASINAYAYNLHNLKPLLWIFRVGLIIVFLIHAYYGVSITLRNRAAKGQNNEVTTHLTATFAGLTMIWTGLLLAAFIIYHLLQFTAHVTPDIVTRVDTAGRADVFTMVVNSFHRPLIAAVYILAMIALFLHLKHGTQSFFQTLGWSDEKSRPKYITGATILAALLFLGFSAIPLTIISGAVGR